MDQCMYLMMVNVHESGDKGFHVWVHHSSLSPRNPSSGSLSLWFPPFPLTHSLTRKNTTSNPRHKRSEMFRHGGRCDRIRHRPVSELLSSAARWGCCFAIAKSTGDDGRQGSCGPRPLLSGGALPAWHNNASFCYLHDLFPMLPGGQCSHIGCGLVRNSCPDHTKLSVRFEPWSCWGLCWEIDVGPPRFTLLQSEMPTKWCLNLSMWSAPQSFLPTWLIFMLLDGQRSHVGCGLVRNSCPDLTKLSVRFETWSCWGLCWEIDVGPPRFTLLQSEMPTKWCLNLSMWSAPQSLLLSTRLLSMLLSGHRCRIGYNLVQNSCPDHTKLSVGFEPMKLLAIILRNRCWPATFHTITPGDANKWCMNWSLLFTRLISMLPTEQHCHIGCSLVRNSCPEHNKLFCPVRAMKMLGNMLRNRCWPATFHIITSEDADDWCLNWSVWSTP